MGFFKGIKDMTDMVHEAPGLMAQSSELAANAKAAAAAQEAAAAQAMAAATAPPPRCRDRRPTSAPSRSPG